MLLFPIHRAFTPYKAKFLIMVKLYENGTSINCHFEHLSEATENSNHGNNNSYNNRTMRDGGYVDRNVTSEFVDLFESFIKAVKLGIRRDSIPTELSSTIIKNLNQHLTWDLKFFPMYLKMCTHVDPSRFPVGRKDPGSQMRGMRFFFIGSYTSMPAMVRPGSTIPKKMSSILLKQLVNEMGGTCVTDGTFESLCDYPELQHCYVVLQDTSLFKLLKEKASSTQDVAGISDKFVKATRSDWNYLSGNYIIDCYTKKELLDTTEYVFDICEFAGGFTKARRARSMTRLAIRQRDLNTAQQKQLQTLPAGQSTTIVPVLHENILCCRRARNSRMRL